jgi:sugar O-acyltransferase (sialic acid O-acetyltransferase NeuD family)
MENVIILGYSGHSYAVIDILRLQGYEVTEYLDKEPQKYDPFSLAYLGSEEKLCLSGSSKQKFMVAIGNNPIRARVFEIMSQKGFLSVNAIHPKSVIGFNVQMGSGNMILGAALINAMAVIGNSVVINSGAIIEHECKIGNYVHIAPGAVLAGNVKVGDGSFIGANAVIKEGINIGEQAIIGAGSVVLKNVADGETVVGNPAKKLR